MKILHLSDTHSQHNRLVNLPFADIIIHSGDFSFSGTEAEFFDFIGWFACLPYKYKIFIAGNHDDCLQGADLEGLPDNCFYLCNSGVSIEGVNFYGMPLFMGDVLLGEYDENIQKMPTNIDILITHQPPFYVLDSSENINYGDLILLQKVLSIQPKYHLFGHIHNAYGIEKIDHTTFINASVVNEEYKLSNNPVLLEL